MGTYGRRSTSSAIETETLADISHIHKTKNVLRNFDQLPAFLQVNPYLRDGYRVYLSSQDCVTSIFSWTNETLNIWTHLLGFLFFAGLLVYDVLVTIPKYDPPFGEVVVMLFLVLSCMTCMACSTAYHTFCCQSETAWTEYLKWDVAGIILAFAAVFLSGIHYAFSCFQSWRVFYESVIVILSVLVLTSHIVSKEYAFKKDKRMTAIFTLWAIFGFVPSLHWTYLSGLDNPLVRGLLPRVGVMYVLIGVAFFFYMSKYPEKCCPGRMDYVGASHQLWHLFVVLALFWWHQSGISYAELKLVYGCAQAT